MRSLIIAVLAAIALVPVGANASIRQNIANGAATKAGNDFVAKIQGENCGQFAATMTQMKGNGSSSSSMASKLKNNAQARTTFVNIVAAPLLNKMIDCNLLPGK
jgi:hypothetical protein